VENKTPQKKNPNDIEKVKEKSSENIFKKASLGLIKNDSTKQSLR
jgi:hypothetical protein